MKRLALNPRWFLPLLLIVAAGCSVPRPKVPAPTIPSQLPPDGRVSQTGIASWYGPGFHGKPTASGVIYNQDDMTAAHQTLPLGTKALVTNLENGRSAEVLINDRGPFAKGRILDLSYAAAQTINMVGPGTALVRIDVIDAPVRISSIRSSLDYTLQLGSFAQLENAQQLRERAQRSFNGVTITPLQSRELTYYRVHMGNFTDRGAAEAMARQVTEAGYSVIIMEK